ncbi:hypothetical protein JOF53_008010 [Crossiella equi]|uniref:PH domain-containing protein n=1 Tax=Crossiella equi TaxID=130796 RepID=A0ABS5ARD9_9PSEU|nr:hypothetical protein [Crossiella equi]MBP2479138.1 hypothetical protein [Crossiella equi]
MTSWELRAPEGHTEPGPLAVALTGLAALTGLLAALAVVGYGTMRAQEAPWRSETMLIVVPIAIAAVLVPFTLYLFHQNAQAAHTVRIGDGRVETDSRRGPRTLPLESLREVTIRHTHVDGMPTWTRLALRFRATTVETRQFPYRGELGPELTSLLAGHDVVVRVLVSETHTATGDSGGGGGG